MELIDLTLRRVNNCIVLERAAGGKHPRWRCLCLCGKEFVALGATLRKGQTRGCRDCYGPKGNRDHGHTAGLRADGGRCTSREYRIWKSLRRRCHNPKSKAYKFYGARGIQVCSEWRDDFPQFLKDVGTAPPGMELDRYPDNDGNYEPGNVRWATRVEQMNNTRRNRFLTHGGETLTLAQWARRTGMPYKKLEGRLRIGWPVERALAAPQLMGQR